MSYPINTCVLLIDWWLFTLNVLDVGLIVTCTFDFMKIHFWCYRAHNLLFVLCLLYSCYFRFVYFGFVYRLPAVPFDMAFFSISFEFLNIYYNCSSISIVTTPLGKPGETSVKNLRNLLTLCDKLIFYFLLKIQLFQ